MKSFKQWLEISFGSDLSRDNAPTQTNTASQQIASKWMADPRNSDVQGNLLNIGQNHKSNLAPNLMNAASKAINFSPKGLGDKTTAPQVGQMIQTSLGLPSVLKPPTIGKVKLMRKHMRSK